MVSIKGGNSGLTVVVDHHAGLDAFSGFRAGIDHGPARAIGEPVSAYFHKSAFYFGHIFLVQFGYEAFDLELVERNFLFFHTDKSLI